MEDKIKKQISYLIDRSQKLKQGKAVLDNVLSVEHAQECSGWITAALNVVQRVCPTKENAYRKRAEKISSKEFGFYINQGVGELSCLLKEMERDIENGLLNSVADQARAEIFDDFLDFAKEYLKKELKNEAGVIAGVVFEDSLRKICRKAGKDDKDEKLDQLISFLVKHDYVSQTKAKRARVAADVRTKATHAQWDEFDSNDVQSTIKITEELIQTHLDK